MVILTREDDDLLFIAASSLAAVADKLYKGEVVEDLPNTLRKIGVVIAGVMADAHDRAIEAEELV